MKTAQERVLDYLKNKLRRNDIELTMHFRDDLGLDSLDMVDLVSFLETMIAEGISDEELLTLTTPQNVVDFLKGKGLS